MVFPVGSDDKSNQVSNQVRDQVLDRIIRTLYFCITPKSRKEILENINLTNKSINFKVNIEPGINANLLQMTIPEKPQSQNQQYKTTNKGQRILRQ
jgi:ATP-dependent DNA helicase RecG